MMPGANPSPHRLLPPLGQLTMQAENHPMLRSEAPAFVLSPPRGQRISPAQLLLEQEMRQAQGKRRKRR